MKIRSFDRKRAVDAAVLERIRPGRARRARRGASTSTVTQIINLMWAKAVAEADGLSSPVLR